MTTDMRDWIGKTETTTGTISPLQADMLQATLGAADHPAPALGDPAPYLWHWTAFAPTVPMSDLAPDGHQHRGGFLPPVPHPRRMWAGGTLTFHAPIRIGDPLRQVSTIQSIDRKSDSMVFVAVAHEVYHADTHLLSEVHNIVYLDIPPSYSPPNPKPVPDSPVFSIDEPMPITRLFRYSAATFNAHRIHYDLSYARDVENYPGLLVHGPLQATLMLAHAARHTGRTPRSFAYRGVHPMFHDDPMQIMGFDATHDSLSVCTVKPGRHQGMHGTIRWAD
ncbi:MaoC family dehydratase N-terminal domain-containing protein [Marivita sp. S6314]|uniref:FAS1-like dehydratase domain-containing protein n=1 Tax=Marivita sp. S6314 TaxID=2926406 RepID=UPI001FF62954|nr:MaoC family dehydratase N-terminal domain-containing protein [Marivita sp. S6314]MCK0149213.1 MaoC family dehydratase N-terminal domain-containing protein [Marivita sp. S6314]